MCRNIGQQLRTQEASRTSLVTVVDTNYAGGVAEDDNVNIQPITRADFVPAKVFRSRSMNTRTGRNYIGRPEVLERRGCRYVVGNVTEYFRAGENSGGMEGLCYLTNIQREGGHPGFI